MEILQPVYVYFYRGSWDFYDEDTVDNPTKSKLIKMASKLTEKNIPVSSHKNELAYKLKTASQQETASSDSSQSSNNMKRPRGRPPLVTSKPTKFVSKAPSVAAKSLPPALVRSNLGPQQKVVSAPSSSGTHQSVQSKPVSATGTALPVAPLHPGQGQAPSSSGTAIDSSTNEAGEQQSKLPRPSASEVTNKLLAVLMVSDPISVADLCKQLPELPRESIQSVLEVLQVLGLIVQMMSSKETSGKSSSANIIYLYALSEFAKFSAPFQITQLQAEMRSNQKTTVEVKSRLEELQALSTKLEDESLDQDTREAMLRETLNKLTQQNASLSEDSLYQAMMEQVGPASASPSAPQQQQQQQQLQSSQGT